MLDGFTKSKNFHFLELRKLDLGELDGDAQAPLTEYVTDASFINVISQMRLHEFSLILWGSLKHVRKL